MRLITCIIHKSKRERHCKPGSLHKFGVNVSVPKDDTESKMFYIAVEVKTLFSQRIHDFIDQVYC